MNPLHGYSLRLSIKATHENRQVFLLISVQKQNFHDFLKLKLHQVQLYTNSCKIKKALK